MSSEMEERMSRIIVPLLTLGLLACAGTGRQQQTPERGEVAESAPGVATSARKASPVLVVVTPHLEVNPEPIGGVAAIAAAVQEPEEVWKQNKMGTTTVEARVDASGKILGTKVYQSSGYAGMDAEAMLAVARVRWKPARKQNRPVEAVVRVRVEFNSSISSKY